MMETIKKVLNNKFELLTRIYLMSVMAIGFPMLAKATGTTDLKYISTCGGATLLIPLFLVVLVFMFFIAKETISTLKR